MDLKDQTIMSKFIVDLDEYLSKFSNLVDERLTTLTDDLNRCHTNLIILEKKIETPQESNGSLIFDYHSQPSNLNADKNIVLASLFYACYANSEQIGLGLSNTESSFSQMPHSTGIKTLEADNFRLDCYETLTKVKFVVISDLSMGLPSTIANKQDLLKKIYELYADYVMKNPFYTLNMPINSDNCSLFKVNLDFLFST